MKKKIFRILLAWLALFYLWPTPKRSFIDLAAAVPADIRQSLLDFRREHPVQYVQVDGKDWAYVTLGKGDETILFLHGMTGAYDIWWQQLLSLADAYRVIAVTYPPVDTLEGLSRGVLAVLDAEGVARAHLVGSSLGGYLAQYLLVHEPQRVGKVVLANTFPPNDVFRAKNERLVQVLPLVPEWLVLRSFRQQFQEVIYPAAGYSDLVLAYLLEQGYGRMSKAQVIARARVVMEPFTLSAEATAQPVLIIESANDPLVPAELRAALRAQYPAATVRTFPAAGHFPYLNEPETYTNWLRAFFAQP